MNLKEIQQELEKNVDLAYKKGSEMTCPTARKICGVRASVLVGIAKKAYKENGFELCEALIRSDYCEEQQICCKVLMFGCKKNTEVVFEFLIKHLSEIRDWCICDTLATQSLAYYSIKNQEKLLELALKGVDGKNFWIRRFWVASLVPLSQKKNKGSLDVDGVLKVLDKVMLDKEKYVQKAIHWVLREVSWRDENKVFEFIKKWLGTAPKSTLWQGSEKLRKELRDLLNQKPSNFGQRL